MFKLREKRGLSQEALAEKLDTTRQAISKWENDQGYPETEKLLLLGNIFDVSIDYLLKNTEDKSNNRDDGYYVSREMAEGYLLATRKIANYIALGFFFIVLAFLPYFIFKHEPTTYTILIIISITLATGMFVLGGLLEESRFKILKQERLVFDYHFLQELNDRYDHLKKKCAAVLIFGICFSIAGIIPFLLEDKVIEAGTLTMYYPFSIVVIAIGIYLFIRTVTMLEAYKLLAHNEEYTSKLNFKLRRILRKKIDEL